MAAHAIGTVVSITAHAPVPGIHGRFGVGMAIQAGERGIIGRIGVAVRTSVPLTFVRAAVNGEVFVVVVEGGPFPGGDAVASLAFLGKSGAGMVGVGRTVVIGQMAGYAFFGQSGIRTVGMAAHAIQLVTTFQGKEPMFEPLARAVPLPTNHVVASVAIGPESSQPMVGAGSGFVFVPMATVAVGADHVVTLFRTRNVAPLALGFRMHADQRKTDLPMDVLHLGIRNKPGGRRVASCAIVANRLLVYVLVALGAIRGGFVEYERRVAFSASHRLVLTHQRETGFGVIETFRFHIVPFLGGVARAALHLELLAMWRLHGKARNAQEQSKNQQYHSKCRSDQNSSL